MCRGVQQNDSSRLKIKSFYLRLTESLTRKPVPDSVTLCYLPRINGSPLEINGSWIRPDSPGFVTLHRVVSGGSVVFGSRERVMLSEGTRFDVYLCDDKLLTRIFRRDDEWNIDVKCVLQREIGVREAEVCVAVEGGAAMRQKVEVVVKNKNNKYSSTKKKYYYCFNKLEEIPEQREGEVAESEGCCCCCCEEELEIGSDGGDEADLDVGMRWAVDVGIWVMCLGVGYLVSKASSKSLRRKIIL